jgi:hypothetical protein
LINLCRSHEKPVVVGGPDATSSPHIYSAADFQVLGEAKQGSPKSASPHQAEVDAPPALRPARVSTPSY